MADSYLKKWGKAVTPPFRPGNRVDYLIDGWAAFAAMNDAINTTFYKNSNTFYIYLLGWYLDIDIRLKDQQPSVLDLLSKAHNDYNVQVRMVLWDQFAFHNNNQALYYLDNFKIGAGILDNNTLYHNVGAHHQKVLLVKGQEGLIAFCGGVDINSDRIKDEGKGSPLHDVHCRIQGNAANDLVDVFMQRWEAHPDHTAIDASSDAWKGPLISATDRVQPNKGKPYGSQNVAIARTFNFVSKQKNCAAEHSIKTSMLNAIKTARRFIYLEDQYLWNFDAAEQLGKALKNIQYLIIVISHSSQVKDSANPDGGEWAHFHFMEIIKANCTKDDYTKVSTFHRVIPKTNNLGPGTYVHAKCWIFDDELAIIGSANCNRRGWESDSEVMAAIVEEQDPSNLTCFAQKLRIELWSKNLGIPVDSEKLKDFRGGNQLWPRISDDPKEGCAVAYYDIAYDYQLVNQYPKKVNLDKIDPGDGNLAACGGYKTKV